MMGMWLTVTGALLGITAIFVLEEKIKKSKRQKVPVKMNKKPKQD